MDLHGTGVEPAALERYIEEQVYSLPGTDRHREQFTVLLTGSRAIGLHKPRSDVDVDVLCPQAVYESVHAASLAAGIIRSPASFWCPLREDGWERYFGKERGRAHFAIVPLEEAHRQIAEYEDVPLWIWTNARILIDPDNQFRRIIEKFHGYPKDLLIRKIKYHWLLAGYWEIDVYPHHKPEDLLAAGASMLNAVNELLRVFFLVEGRPFPYTEKLAPYAGTTDLGRRFGRLLERVVKLAVGEEERELSAWDRLEKAFELICCCDVAAEARELEEACFEAMIAAGLDKKWVEADYDNIDELLMGRLGPLP